MANLLDHDLTYVSFPIIKTEKTADGDLLVWGKATDGSVDSDQQIVDPAWSAKALEKWLSTGGNVRVMHSTSHLPAGKGVEVDTSNADGHYVRALVVEPTAQRLVSKGVLQAYSVGISNPRIVRDPTARGGRIVGGDIHELSLVDRPANKNCGITLVKSIDGEVEDVAELFGTIDWDDELTKGKKPAFLQDDDVEDEDAALDNDDDQDEDDLDDDDDAGEAGDVAKGAWALERAAWLAAEPRPDPEASRTGTAFLAKRAAWDRWHADGEARGLDDAADAYGRWLNRHDTDPADGGGEEFVDQLPASLSVATKGMKDCPGCGADYHADAKTRRCEDCGTKLPKTKARKSFKGAGTLLDDLLRPLPADTRPAERHREPDGDAVEDLERDAGMRTDPDPVPDRVPASLKVSAYQVQRMHDATCAAFDWRTVAEEYPSLKSAADAVVPAFFLDQMQAAALKGNLTGVTSLAETVRAADEMHKGIYDPDAVADGHAALHKAFAEMYPNTRVTPGSVTPGMFQRPYISAGHAPQTAPAGRTPNVPPSSRVPDPNDFDRPLITEGHEAESPGDRGDNLRTGSVSSGSARRFYSNAAKTAARNAMRAMHDHISDAFPDMCPMAASKAAVPPDMRDTARPRPTRALDVPAAPGEKAAGVSVKKAKGLGRKQVAKIVKSAVAEATKSLHGGYETQISALQAEIDYLAGLPDPTQAPVRGVVRTKAATSTSDGAAPVERVSLVEAAQAQAAVDREEHVAFVTKFLNHPDPAKRELAEEQLRRLLATP